jgi:TPR repeat protein
MACSARPATRHASVLLQRALKLAQQDDTSAVTFAANLFCDVSQAAGLSLLQRMADDGDAGAMSALCDLYKGRLGGRDQPQFADVEKAAYWQERAVEGGDLIATYNLAVRLVAAGARRMKRVRASCTCAAWMRPRPASACGARPAATWPAWHSMAGTTRTSAKRSNAP